MNADFDVLIAGGGLAGLTLGLQLKKMRPETRICIVEKSDGKNQIAGHKVGESTVELGTYYLREVLGLGEYLSQEQLPKHGLRFFLTPSNKKDIEKRFEIGPVYAPKVPSHQLDRGILENKLIELNRELGNQVELGSKASAVEFGEDVHQIEITGENGSRTVHSKWIVDATGRGSLIKRKLGLQQEIGHDINAVWFRVKGEINVTDWSTNPEWRNKVPDGNRRLSTNHLMDKGYWVWIIPLVSGYTSVGIVADPRYHDFKAFNRYELALNWIKEHEPQFYDNLDGYKDEMLDFKVLRNYSHDTKQIFSEDRWALVGESGPFLDPFYSPGTDLISLANTWTSDLIVKQLNGLDTYKETIFYEKVYRAIINSWIEVYRDKYVLYGSTNIMALKIVWDWSYYWSIHTTIFTNQGYTDMEVLKSLFIGRDSIGERLAQLSFNIQELFKNWYEIGVEEVEPKYMDPFEVAFLKDFHHSMVDKLNNEDLITRVKSNLTALEKIGAEMIRYVKTLNGEQNMDEFVNPYVDNVNGKTALLEQFADFKYKRNESIANELEKICHGSEIVGQP